MKAPRQEGVGRRAAGARFYSPPSIRATTAGGPCPTKRKGCPVQLAFKDGQAYLRFCEKVGRPGHLVSVSSPAEAKRMSEEICGCWSKSKNFRSCGVQRNGRLGKAE